MIRCGAEVWVTINDQIEKGTVLSIWFDGNPDYTHSGVDRVRIRLKDGREFELADPSFSIHVVGYDSCQEV